MVYPELVVDDPKVRIDTELALALVVSIALETDAEVGSGVPHLLNPSCSARSKCNPKSGLASGVCWTQYSQ